MNNDRVVTATFDLGIPLTIVKTGNGVRRRRQQPTGCPLRPMVQWALCLRRHCDIDCHGRHQLHLYRLGQACAGFGINPVCTVMMDTAKTGDGRFRWTCG